MIHQEFETPEQVYDKLQRSIRHVVPESVVPDFELRYKAELVSNINRLLVEKNAIALLHNYMDPILYFGVNGVRGDSLELARKAAQTNADIILFCGVYFMAETAFILNPSKKVLIPSLEAGCSLADGAKPEDARWLRKKFPGLPIVTYINSYAALKAETDVCATSGNVMAVIDWARREFNTKSVIFMPDKYMAGNIAREKGMQLFYPPRDSENPAEGIDYQNIPTIIGWDAACYVHEQYRPEHVRQIISTYPGALIIAHQEVPSDTMEEVKKHGGRSGSTSEMIRDISNMDSDQMVATMTECSLADNLLAARPDLGRRLIRMCNQRCKFMKTSTLEDVYDALTKEQYVVTVPEDTRQKAELSVKRMLAI